MRFLHLIPAISHFYIAAQALGATFNATLWKKIGAVISTEVRENGPLRLNFSRLSRARLLQSSFCTQQTYTKSTVLGRMQARALNNQEETLGQAITGVALWTPDINLYLHLPRSALPTLLCSVNFALPCAAVPCPAVPCPAVSSVCACPCVV
jgi:hypothetical protein